VHQDLQLQRRALPEKAKRHPFLSLPLPVSWALANLQKAPKPDSLAVSMQQNRAMLR
jgi:hypothetical protein